MKILSCLFSTVLCFSACAQFTAEPPGHHTSSFLFTTNAAVRRPDFDARNFILRAGLANATQISAIVQLVKDLKTAKVWPKLAGFYPFVGGTSNACAQNLVSPAFTISWNGPINMASGIRGNGTNYGDTGYAPIRGNPTNFHLYGWIAADAITNGGAIFGTGSASPVSHSYLFLNNDGNFQAWGPNGNYSNGSLFSGGNFLMQRTNSTTCLVQTDSVVADVDEALTSPSTNTIKVLAAVPANGLKTGGTLRAFSFGKSLTYSETTNLFAIVNRFQTALGRGTP